MGIRGKLIPLLLLTALLPMAAMGVLTYYQSRDTLEHETLGKLEALAASQETRLNDLGRTFSRRLSFVSTSTEVPRLIPNGDSGQLRAELANVKQTITEATEVSVFDTSGAFVASTNATAPDLSADPTFPAVRQGLVRPVITKDEQQKLYARIAGPVSAGGETAGYVTITAPATVLETIGQETAGLGTTGEYNVVAPDPVTGDTVTLTQPRFEPGEALNVRVNRNQSNRAGNHALNKEEGAFTHLVNYRGHEILAATRYIDSLDWGLVVKIDTAEAYQPARDLRNILLILGAVLSVLMLLIVTEITYSITRPLVRLTRLTERIGRGKLAERAPVSSNDEIGRLGASINAMAERLSRSQSTLRQRVGDLSRSEKKVRHQARHDALTGLANRISFQEHLDAALEASRKKKNKVAVLFLDLDRFKAINDSLGHVVGDKLLEAIAERFSGLLRKDELLSRFGGDEFAVLVPKVKGRAELSRLSDRLLTALDSPFEVDGYELFVDTSIGIALGPKNGSTGEQLLRNADIALYRAKNRGGTFEYFDKAMGLGASERLSLETDLRKAFDRKEFEMYYQLIANPQGKVIGAEALIRWNHPELGLLLPDQFIPQIEAIGLSDEMGQWTIEQTCRDIRRWSKEHRRLCVAVNLSPRQFAHMDLVRTVRSALRKTKADPKLLEIEITESAAMQQFEEAAAKTAALKKMGINLALDDFGTGYSSLSQLSRLPIDKLKIDKSFIRNADKSKQDLALIKSIILIGESLGLGVVVEGVENAKQMRLVTSLGCKAIQGYHLGRPVRAEIFEEQVLGGSPGFASATA